MSDDYVVDEIRYMRSGPEMLEFLERHCCHPREIPFSDGEWEYEIRFVVKLGQNETPPSMRKAVLRCVERMRGR